MAWNRGKDFESRFKQDFKKSFPDSFIMRIPDQMSGYKQTSRNYCDFICFDSGRLYLLELKTHEGASIPFSAIPQYDMLVNVDCKGLFKGVVIWLYDKDLAIYLPISTIKKMKIDGEKSFGVRHLEDPRYPCLILPSKKKKVFLDIDYTPLKDLEEGN